MIKYLFITILIYSGNLFAEIGSYNLIKYKTYFDNCPTKSAGEFTLKIIKAYEKEKSLYELKRFIDEKELQSKYYIESFNISKDPITSLLKISLKCPEVLARAQINNGQNPSYSAILTKKGELIDPNYEVLLRSDNSNSLNVPLLVFSLGEKGLTSHEDLTILLNKIDKSIYNNISELILDDKFEMTAILSVNNISITVFLGDDNWSNKFNNLSRMLKYFKIKKKFPSVVNLTNLKKIVVKFSDAI